MTERKFNSYTLWLKWRNTGWKPHITILNLPFPADNPRDILKEWRWQYYTSKYWIRGKTWVILPDDRRPKC